MTVDYQVPASWHPEEEPASQPEATGGAAEPSAAETGAARAAAAPEALPAVATADAAGSAAGWSLAQRIAFRFAFCYLLLYNLLFPLELLPIPGLSALAMGYYKLWDAIVLWTGRHVFHLSHDIEIMRGRTGSGDTTYDYVQLLWYVVLAAVGALVWTLAARQVREHRRLHGWLRIFVRYVLAVTLIGYGMAKVIKTQFTDPSPDRLMQPFGDASPMGLLWTFMGASTPYTFFAGAMEMLGGVLLLFRRTTTLGALVTISVMTNVVMLNFCYDVPVKLYSLNLLLMAAFLTAPDLRRLADVLLLNRPTTPVSLAPPFQARWARISSQVAKTLLIGWVLYSNTEQNLGFQKQMAAPSPRPPLYGTFEVEDFVRNGRAVPPSLTETERWRRVSSVFNRGVSVRFMNDTRQFFLIEYAKGKPSFSLSTRKPGAGNTLSAAPATVRQGTFTYTSPDKDHLVLQGTLRKDTLAIKLRRVDPAKFLLISRGFHWINELPFNQ